MVRGMVNVEKAKVYAELAREKMDGIWNRRRVSWRTSFVLWAALGAASSLLYREANKLPAVLWIYILVAFIVILISYSWHWIGAYISDEKAFHWAHYYQGQAEKYLGKHIEDTEKITRPKEMQGWKFYLWEKHVPNKTAFRKLHAIIPQIIVTIALMAIVLYLLYGKMDPLTNIKVH
jgi:hypothetical protein